MEKSRLILPHALTPLNGCVLDLESPIGTIQLTKGPLRKNTEAAPAVTRHIPRSLSMNTLITVGPMSEQI